MLTPAEAMPQLNALLKARKLAIMVGSGISVSPPSSLPTWDGFMAETIDWCERFQKRLIDNHEIDPANAPLTPKFFADAKAHSQGYPGQVGWAMKEAVRLLKDATTINVEHRFQEWLTDRFLVNCRANANHNAIVTTDYPIVLTTNYDNLLESAARAAGLESLADRTYGYDDPERLASVVFREDPAIVHIHGSARDITLDKIIFTSHDYTRLRNEEPALSICLQAIFLRYSVLFVGYGMSDPHLEELVEDISHVFASKRRADERYYIVLRKDKANEVAIRYKKNLSTRIIGIDDYADTTHLLTQLQLAFPRK